MCIGSFSLRGVLHITTYLACECLGAFAGPFVPTSRIASQRSLTTAVPMGKYVAAVVDDMAVLVVHRLDPVGGTDDLADRGSDLQE